MKEVSLILSHLRKIFFASFVFKIVFELVKLLKLLNHFHLDKDKNCKLAAGNAEKQKLIQRMSSKSEKIKNSHNFAEKKVFCCN